MTQGCREIAKHPEFPLECRCSDRTERRQLAFAARALDLLPQRPDAAYEADATGLCIYAETELALERPLSILKDVYGQSLHIEPPTIRYRVADVVEEPHMSVRVLCASSHFPAVRQNLLARGAAVLDEELRPPVGVIRATAPLRKLIGYSQWLAQHTSGNAREVMWLDHYAPCADAALEAVSRAASARQA
jgi:translation elongation factor EF-G